jgi:hypothetical protein
MRQAILTSVFILLFIALLGPQRRVLAQVSDGQWSDFVNISNSPVASTYPAVASDTAGNLHVLWSEDIGGKTSNPSLKPDGSPLLDTRGKPVNVLDNIGNTLYYSRWDGEQWSSPVDVQANSGGYIEYPRAVVDNKGVLHAVWVATQAEFVRVMYSRVEAGKADSITDWSQPVVLVDPSLAIYYPVDISVDSKGGLHVLYSQIGDRAGAYVINSTDGGDNWSDPVQLFATMDAQGASDGVSTVRLVVDAKDRLHATWTRYDQSGNGKSIYYAQSTDYGQTWSRPFEVAAWQMGWYETDWLSAGVVGDEIHLIWEGGVGSYLNECISEDGGKTWGDNLVGENGFASLVVDSANQLHMLVVKRGEHAESVHGIWYTTWDQDHWSDPILLGTNNFILYWKMNKMSMASIQEDLVGTFTGGGLRYQVASILNGNELFVVVVNEYGGDIWGSESTLSAPEFAPKPYPQATAPPTMTVVPDQPLDTPTPTPLPNSMTSGAQQGGEIQPTTMLILGVMPAVLIIFGYLLYARLFKRP